MGEDDEVLKYRLETASGEKPCSIGFTGAAVAHYPNGDKFDGVFKDGQRQGKGSYTYKNGDVFEGYFDKVKSGLGRVTYAKGGFFQGYFVDGKREGEGTFKYPNGDIYSGFWKAGKKHGKGTYVFAGTKYEYKGEWKNGQITTGTWKFSDGTTYIGGFQAQKPCGDGTWQTAKGTIVEGAYVQQVVPIDDSPIVPGKPPETETRTFWKTAAMIGADD